MKKNNLDEMQEQKLLKIEHNGMWFAFWALIVAMVVQLLLGITSPFQLIGELIIFMALAFYLSIACLRHGIWDRHLKANAMTNCIASLIGGICVSLLDILRIYIREQELRLFASILEGIFTFVLTFALLQLCATLYKKRLKKLESE